MSRLELEYESLDPKAVSDIATSDETAAFVFIAEHMDRETLFSMAYTEDRSGEKEAELLANYISKVASRTGKDRESFVREIVEKLNEINHSPPHDSVKRRGGVSDE